MTTLTMLAAAALVLLVPSVLYYRTGYTWHVIERPEPDQAKTNYYGEATALTGKLQVCVARRRSTAPLVVGTCDFDDDDARGDLVVAAEARAAHLNRVRNAA